MAKKRKRRRNKKTWTLYATKEIRSIFALHYQLETKLHVEGLTIEEEGEWEKIDREVKRINNSAKWKAGHQRNWENQHDKEVLESGDFYGQFLSQEYGTEYGTEKI